MAPITLVTAKGGRQHKRWGKVYLFSMGGVAPTALPLVIMGVPAIVATTAYYLQEEIFSEAAEVP